jgi:recombination associated protein RdgC
MSENNMWFKNLIVYQIHEKFDLDEDTLPGYLDKMAFKGCGAQELSTLGWVPPMGDLSDQFLHTDSGMFLLTTRREERIMPAGVIKDAVEDKVLQIEKREERKVGRKQKMEIREDLIFSMMPRAFTRSSRIQGLIIPDQNLLVIDSANRNKAEEWVSLLRKTLGKLSVKPVEVKKSASGLLTAWLSGNLPLPASIVPGDECELQSPREERSVIICRRQDLDGEEIKSHLKAGKLVTRMAIEWNQSLSFVVNEAIEIKKLRFGDIVMEQAVSDGYTDKAAEFDAQFNMMALELSRFLPALWEVFGGLEVE